MKACSPDILRVLEQLTNKVKERRVLIDNLRQSLDRETSQRGPLKLRMRRTGILYKIDRISEKVTMSEKLLDQLRAVCNEKD